MTKKYFTQAHINIMLESMAMVSYVFVHDYADFIKESNPFLDGISAKFPAYEADEEKCSKMRYSNEDLKLTKKELSLLRKVLDIVLETCPTRELFTFTGGEKKILRK